MYGVCGEPGGDGGNAGCVRSKRSGQHGRGEGVRGKEQEEEEGHSGGISLDIEAWERVAEAVEKSSSHCALANRSADMGK